MVMVVMAKVISGGDWCKLSIQKSLNDIKTLLKILRIKMYSYQSNA